MIEYAIDAARAADRDELLDFLLTAFRVNAPQHPPFDALYPDLFGANDAAMGRHLVIREGGRIAACVGAYPMDVRIGPCSVRVAGIGQVACAPDRRGGGRMTALLDAAVARLPDERCALSWLSGRRDRYARFGWELAGAALRLGMDARSVGAAPAGWSIECLSSQDSLADNVWQLRMAQPILEELPLGRWLVKLQRGQTHVWVARREGSHDAAAFAVARQDGSSLQEWGGDTGGLHAIAAAAVARYGGLSVTCLPGTDPSAALFWSIAVWSSGALSNLLVVDLAATLAAYAPLVHERLPPGVGAMLVMTRQDREVGHFSLGNGGERIVLDRCLMARLLFGPTPPSALLGLPPRLRWLDQVFPLPFLLPADSHV
jgi:predicted N-acetyltransferase YhbS